MYIELLDFSVISVYLHMHMQEIIKRSIHVVDILWCKRAMQ